MKTSITKQHLLIGLATVLASLSLTFTSCSNDGSDVISEDPSETSSKYQELLSSLDEYAGDYLANASENPQLRKFLKIDLFWQSVKSDYFSYNSRDGVHHEVLCISTSRQKWIDLNKPSLVETKLPGDGSADGGHPGDIPGDNGNSSGSGNPGNGTGSGTGNGSGSGNGLSPEDIKIIKHQIDSLKYVYHEDKTNFGALHNAAVLNILLTEDFSATSTLEIVQETVESLKDLGMDVSGIDINEEVEKVDFFFDKIYSDNDEELCNRLIQYNPTKKNEILVLKNYMSNVQKISNPQDVVKFTNGYVSLVEKSKIDNVSKTQLKTNLSIAPASFSLWQQVAKVTKK